MHFARLLRTRYPSPVVYRIFVDRRWDSLPGVYYARKEYNVSFTATVRMNAKYHVVANWSGVVKKSKSMRRRGKYRSATVTVNGITFNTCLWNDSSLLGGISTDLGCEDDPVVRRTGRHLPHVSCPRMMRVRGMHFRAVDGHDQLRACKFKMAFSCKRKAWPNLVMGLYEICVVNIYVVKSRGARDQNLKQDSFRWALVMGMVSKAKELDERRARNKQSAEVKRDATPRRSRRQRGVPPSENTSSEVSTTEEAVPRFERAKLHHHDRLDEYVTPEQARVNMGIAMENPTRRELQRAPRARDAHRKKKKVRNPLFTSASVCLVCKYQYGRRRETLRYCRECCVESFAGWPRTNRATGFAKAFHPRLCSTECFEYFHTHNVKGLDYCVKRQRSSKNVQKSGRPKVAQSVDNENNDETLARTPPSTPPV